MSTHYTHIKDLPLYNWRECQQGNIEYTRKDLEVGTIIQDNESWDSIYNSFLEKFDVGKKFRQFYMKQNQLTGLFLEFAQSGDRFLLNEIEVLKSEMEALSKGGEPYSIDDCIADVSKWLGSIIDEQKTTTLQFYSLHARMVKDYSKKT